MTLSSGRYRDSLLYTNFAYWYPRIMEFSIESQIISSLSSDFILYLRSDSIILPDDSKIKSNLSENEDDDDNDMNVMRSYENYFSPDASSTLTKCSFFDHTEMKTKFNNSKKILGEKIIVRTNWHCPDDAFWMINSCPSSSQMMGNISYDEMIILLKCSDKSSQDIKILDSLGAFSKHDDKKVEHFHTENTSSFDDRNNYYNDSDSILEGKQNRWEKLELNIIIRKWIDMNPSEEFRCFVNNRKLVGICQKNISTYEPYLELNQTAIKNTLGYFIEEIILKRLEDLRKCFIDIYWNFLSDHSPLVINIDEWSSKDEDLLLFDREELEKTNSTIPFDLSTSLLCPFKFVKREIDTKLRKYSQANLPVELAQISLSELMCQLKERGNDRPYCSEIFQIT